MKCINVVNFFLIDMIKVYLSGIGLVFVILLRKKIIKIVFMVLKIII